MQLMAAAAPSSSSTSRGSGGKSEILTEHQQPKRLWRSESEQPQIDRNVVWSEPQTQRRRVPVLYYLSRNGHLDHPHFMEVPLSSPPSLFLKDVINRLNVLRGKGMASMYSWSCKRSYKNGYVWHDLSENDLIHAAHGHDYILKGSELPEIHHSADAGNTRRRRNQSCSSIDFEYNAHSKSAADVEIEVSTPTPQSDSSPETLGNLMKAEGPAAAATSSSHENQLRCRSSSTSVLMQLISCGSMAPFKDCGAGGGGEQKMRGPRGGRVNVKEYFSGSFVEETNKLRETPTVKRSNSYTAADRNINLEVAEKEMEERVKVKCIPTKIKAHSSSSTRKELKAQ